MSRLLAPLLLASLAAAPAAAESTWTLRTIPEWHESRDDSPFATAKNATGLGISRWRNEAELRTGLGPLDLILTARSTAERGRTPDNELVVNQATLAWAIGKQRIGLGKRIFGWDTGFGFRPLDVIQRENRRALYAPTLEGVPFVSWEGYGADSSWMLVYANPGRGRTGDPVHDESLAWKYYRRLGETDLHGVARYSRRFGLEAGAGFSRVIGDALEVHGSALGQQRYERNIDTLIGSPALLSPTDPVETRRFKGGLKALAGASWSTEGGTTLLGEAWYDAAAYTAGEWRAAADLARRQGELRGLPGVPAGAVDGNLAWGAQYFSAPNLLRGNVLLRLSHRAPGSDLETAADLLATPADGGRVLTLSAAWIRDRYRIDAGLRLYGGPADAAYRLLPERRVGFVAWQLAF